MQVKDKVKAGRRRKMKAKIHKFYQNGMYILLDVNSGAVHVIDKMIYEIMDTFDGTNDAAVMSKLADSYKTGGTGRGTGRTAQIDRNAAAVCSGYRCSADF